MTEYTKEDKLKQFNENKANIDKTYIDFERENIFFQIAQDNSKRN